MKQNVWPACDPLSPVVTISLRSAGHALLLVKSVPVELQVALMKLCESYLRR
jgi:hypothetical protein